MLPRAARILIVVFLVSGAAGCFGQAQAAPAQAAPQVRYQFGDDPDGSKGWANPNFDDSSWPLAIDGQWPEPEFYSSGFVWVRIVASVRSDTAAPLALRIGSLSRIWLADEVFVNGIRVGSFGRLPPDPYVPALPIDTVFDLPSGLTHPGAVVHIALRIWYPPYVRRSVRQVASLQVGRSTGFDAASFTFDQSRTLHAEEDASRGQARLRNVFPFTLDGFILLIGIALLLLARWSRSRDLYLYGALLTTLFWITFFFELIDARFLALSETQCAWFQVISQLPAMIITIEFIWRINRFRDVWFKGLTYASMAFFNLGVLIAFAPANPSVLVAAALPGYSISLQAFNVLTLVANLFVIFFKRQRRLIAFAMMLVPCASLASGFRNTTERADLFDLAFFLASFFLTAILAHQAWKEWRARDALQAEFEAARELQQLLVSPAADLPGFQIESVYAPAKHVGGDFFYLHPEEDGGILVVVGDVSGKGLRAAMTVNSVMGALRTIPALPPARILGDLNRGLIGQMQGGFVTCCAARITPDGSVTLANAGHLPPYLDGVEAPVRAGLPLGIDSRVAYEESRFSLQPASSLTFVSDGVVEARNASGELFGFERTAAISTQSAQDIARAAQHFGQEDDITVLTLAFAPTAVPA